MMRKTGTSVMKNIELKQMSADDLWDLYVEVGEALAVKLVAEKKVLEERLKPLNAKPSFQSHVTASERRQYPRVFPKFRNPNDASETWAGRGKQPRWLLKPLKSGHRVDEFRIQGAE